MKGLRTQESNKFEHFFNIVQKTAEKKGAVFFFDTGQGNDIITDEIEGEDLTGWLVPADLADDFETEFNLGQEMKELWDVYYVWAEWYLQNHTVEIKFKSFND